MIKPESIRRIVFTLPGGGVGITSPAPEMLRVWSLGGFPHLSAKKLKDQEARAGRSAIAVRFAKAMTEGGLTTAECYALIRDRDCMHQGHDFELMEFGELPEDRWFRNAWRRGGNGGVRIDLEAARPIQLQRIASAWRRLPPWEQSIDWGSLRQRVAAAQSCEELRTIALDQGAGHG